MATIDPRIAWRQRGFIWNAAKNAYEKPDRVIPSGLPNAQPERSNGQALELPASGENQSQARLVVCIIRRSIRLLDADNFAGGCKPLIDQLRYCNLIPNDDPGSIELIFRQEQVRHKNEEGTAISIKELCAKSGEPSPGVKA